MASERLFRSQVDSVLSADGRRPVTPASNRITERDTDTTASPGQSARGETSGRAPLMPVRRLADHAAHRLDRVPGPAHAD